MASIMCLRPMLTKLYCTPGEKILPGTVGKYDGEYYVFHADSGEDQKFDKWYVDLHTDWFHWVEVCTPHSARKCTVCFPSPQEHAPPLTREQKAFLGACEVLQKLKAEFPDIPYPTIELYSDGSGTLWWNLRADTNELRKSASVLVGSSRQVKRHLCGAASLDYVGYEFCSLPRKEDKQREDK